MTDKKPTEDELIDKLAKLEFEDYRLIRRGKYKDVIGLRPEGIACILALIKAGRKAGIKEVVEWIEKTGFNRDSKGLFISWDEWQSKLKEWDRAAG